MAGILPPEREGRRGVEYTLFALAGLFVVSLAAPANADDSQSYVPPQKIAKLRVMDRSGYNGCIEVKREIGRRSEESYFGCSWTYNHMSSALTVAASMLNCCLPNLHSAPGKFPATLAREASSLNLHFSPDHPTGAIRRRLHG